MAETGTIASAAAHQIGSEQPSKEELQRRMDEARDAISDTVGEIKDTVVHQYDVVKEALDWREQFKKRPVIVSVGAASAGLVIGWTVASVIPAKKRTVGFVPSTGQTPQVRPPARPQEVQHERKANQGPGLWTKLAATPVYHEIRNEGASLGKSFVGELTKIGREVLIPAITGKVRKWLDQQVGEGRSQRNQRTREPESIH